MTVLQYIAALALIGFGGLITTANGWLLIQQLRGNKTASIIPIFGGVLLCAGALVFPGGAIKPFGVLGLLIDYGCLPYITLFTISMIQESRRYAPSRRMLSLDFEGIKSSGSIYVYPENECIYEWVAKDGLSRGSMIMKVEAYNPNKELRISIEETIVSLAVQNGKWQLESEKGWRDPVHSLMNSSIHQKSANKLIQRDAAARRP